jgi:hypothetical protein
LVSDTLTLAFNCRRKALLPETESVMEVTPSKSMKDPSADDIGPAGVVIP